MMSTRGVRTPALKRIRERQFLTQQELADKAGVSWTTVARLESGREDGQQASYRTLRALARALKVKPDDLIGAADQPGTRS